MTRSIRLGISTCPNDTFAFHGLLAKKVDWRGLEFVVELLDIQELNERLKKGVFDVAKASFHAALQLAQNYIVLPTGSALGFGVGPLLLATHPEQRPCDLRQLTLTPGEDTTASLLYELYYHDTARVEEVVFSDIVPRLVRGSADFGICIHEGRFTWQSSNLFLVEDLGERWEKETGSPLPLGGLLASRSLPHDVIVTVHQVIRDSLLYALAERSSALTTMRTYAQEFDDDVLMKHVDLYVNEWTLELGEVGRDALSTLSRRAQERGIGTSAQLEVFSSTP